MEKNTQDKIDDYLLGRLDKEELAKFEQELEQTEDLRKELEEQENTIDYLDMLGDQRMKAKLQGMHKIALEQEEKRPVQTGRYRQLFIRVAAVAAAIALVFTAYFIGTQPVGPEQLFAANYESYPLTFGSRSAEEDAQLIEASIYYKDGKFEQALPIFQQALGKYPDNSKLLLATANSLIELQRYEEAIQQLNLLIDREDPLYFEQALWYTALVKMQLGDLAITKDLLTKLIESDSSTYRQQAEQLLEQL